LFRKLPVGIAFNFPLTVMTPVAFAGRCNSPVNSPEVMGLAALGLGSVVP